MPTWLADTLRCIGEKLDHDSQLLQQHRRAKPTSGSDGAMDALFEIDDGMRDELDRRPRTALPQG